MGARGVSSALVGYLAHTCSVPAPGAACRVSRICDIVVAAMGLWTRIGKLLRPRRNWADDLGGLRDAVRAMAGRLGTASVDHALIGGVALAARGVVRGTRDVDFLIDADGEERVHQLMSELGFETLQRTADVSNYLLGSTRVDYLHARRSYTRAMLARASRLQFGGVWTKVVAPEDLIGLKLQALSNDPTRSQDQVDIDQLLRLPGRIDMDLVREYFRLFDREAELDAFVKANARDV